MNPTSDNAASGEPCRVLCVDDDPVAQRILVTTLARPGFSVECVGDGQDAIARFTGDARGFDLLVTDHAMPRIDGLGLVRRLRAAGFAGRVIVVSAGVGPSERTVYRTLGVTTFFPKPFLRADLLAAVDAVDAPTTPQAHASAAAKTQSSAPFIP